MRFFILLFTFGLFTNVYSQSEIHVRSLKCDFKDEPIDIDNIIPIFSWIMESQSNNQLQTAYELIVSDKLEEVQVYQGRVWSSGKVNSSNNIHIKFQGKPLESFAKYYWRVRVFDLNNQATEWSDIASFETAMMKQSDWLGNWIGDGSKVPSRDEDFYKNDPAPLFAKDILVSKEVISARLYISGLGYYEAFMNGNKIGSQFLDAGWTSYDKQILYAVHNISDLIKMGNNKFGVIVGNGWYNPLPMRFWGHRNFREVLSTGRPILRAQIKITYNDGSTEIIGTDDNWKVTKSPILRNNIFLGEYYDARLEDKEWFGLKDKNSNWENAKSTDGPVGIMSAQISPPIRAYKEITPLVVIKQSDGKFLFDMGENFAGIVKIKVKGSEGVKISLRYGEDIHKDGSINVMTSVAGQIKKSGVGGPGAPEVAWQEDNYILKGKGIEEWMPRFTFHSFRYVEVSGWPGVPTVNDLKGLALASDLKRAGEFSCSNEMFNSLYQVINRTFLSNVFSVQSDCPAREKLGYGGDIVATAESFIYNYDMHGFYRKTVQDFANDQRLNGGITETAPYVGISDEGPDNESGPLGWQLAYPLLIKQLYEFYGDSSIIVEHYDNLNKQVTYLKSKAQNNLYFIGLSDHEAIDQRPIELTASLFYYHHVMLMVNFSQILDKLSERELYLQDAAKIKQSIIKRFVQSDGKVDNGTQTAQLFALWYDIFDTDETQDKLIKKLQEAFISRDWHLSTGIFGTKMIFDVLRKLNKPEWAYRIANQKDFPGWGYMIENDATTLWETWAYSHNMYSQNHPMFGSINEWFYKSILGINQASTGFEKIIIKPQLIEDLDWAKGSYTSVRGEISCDWKVEEDVFSIQVKIPVNSTAEIWIPLNLNGKTLKHKKPRTIDSKVSLIREDENYAIYKVSSGVYKF